MSGNVGSHRLLFDRPKARAIERASVNGNVGPHGEAIPNGDKPGGCPLTLGNTRQADVLCFEIVVFRSHKQLFGVVPISMNENVTGAPGGTRTPGLSVRGSPDLSTHQHTEFITHRFFAERRLSVKAIKHEHSGWRRCFSLRPLLWCSHRILSHCISSLGSYRKAICRVGASFAMRDKMVYRSFYPRLSSTHQRKTTISPARKESVFMEDVPGRAEEVTVQTEPSVTETSRGERSPWPLRVGIPQTLAQQYQQGT